MIRFFGYNNQGFFFKPPIQFKDDNLSSSLEYEYSSVSSHKELIEFIFEVFSEIDFYNYVDRVDDFERALVEDKLQILKEIAYPLYSYMTNRSFETKQFKMV